MNKANLFIFGGLAVFIVLIVVLGTFFDRQELSATTATFWRETEIACLPLGHQNLEVHIHPSLSILVDGQQETIPADIGITDDCMAEIHTHDESGQIHVESLNADKASQFTLSDFFKVWGREVQREGYVTAITVNGLKVDKASDLIFKDLDQIVINYTSSSTDRQL